MPNMWKIWRTKNGNSAKDKKTAVRNQNNTKIKTKINKTRVKK